jgi:hypothetical protein
VHAFQSYATGRNQIDSANDPVGIEVKDHVSGTLKHIKAASRQCSMQTMGLALDVNDAVGIACHDDRWKPQRGVATGEVRSTIRSKGERRYASGGTIASLNFKSPPHCRHTTSGRMSGTT